MKKSNGERIFQIFNIFFLGIFALTCIYPFLYVLSASLSSGDALEAGKVYFFPVGFTLQAYKSVLSMHKLFLGYANTVFYAFFGTIYSMLLVLCGAYPISKKRLMGRKYFSLFILITMFVGAGIIPIYLNIKSLGLLDSRWGIVIALAFNTFNVYLMMSYFSSIPESLEEAAKINGANDIYILFRIILPLSLPALATVSLFFLIQRWNSWFFASILLSDETKIPLQVYLKKLLTSLSPPGDIAAATAADTTSNVSVQTVTYATIMVSILPIVAVYPYIQKFFVQGVMIGAIKQ